MPYDLALDEGKTHETVADAVKVLEGCLRNLHQEVSMGQRTPAEH